MLAVLNFGYKLELSRSFKKYRCPGFISQDSHSVVLRPKLGFGMKH